MDSIKEKVEKVQTMRNRLYELKEEVLRLEKIIKENEKDNVEENICEEEYALLKRYHKEARMLLSDLKKEKEHWREITKIILNE